MRFRFPIDPLLVGAAALLLTLGLPGIGLAFLGPSLDGYLDVTAVQSEVDALDRETLRQDYSIRWSKEPLPYLGLRAAVRYLKFDLDETQTPSAWREEFQPTAELIWSHPLFSVSVGGRHRSSKARNSGSNVVRDNLAFALQTRNFRYPIATIRYDWDQLEDNLAGGERGTEDRRLQIGLDYTVRGHSLRYSFTRRLSENIVSGLDSRQNDHVFRWSNAGVRLFSGRLRVGASYTLNRTTQVDEMISSGRFLQVVPVAMGLYGEDSSPDFGELASVPSLVDGNDDAPVQPEIDIGGANENRNTGVDLGYRRSIGAVYLYTDRASGSQPGWSVFGSDDNLSWQLWTDLPSVEFNASLERYEIVFETRSARYVKVVNRGLNEITEVFVTEVEVLEELQETEKTEQERALHQGDSHVSYLISDALTSSLDLSYRRESGRITVGRRDQAFYALTTRLQQGSMIHHTLRWQQDFQDFEDRSEDLTDNTATYNLLLEPLETLEFLVSAHSRITRQDRTKERESNGVLGLVRGTPYQGFSISGEIGKSRNNEYSTTSRHDILTYRVSLDGSLTRSISGTVSFSSQETRSLPADTLRTRDLYEASFSYRVTRTIFLRGSFYLNDDLSDSVTQDYLVSWNMTPKLSMSAQAYLTDPGDDRDTIRCTANLSYQIGSRRALYLSFTHADFSRAGGSETTSFQQGFRTGF